MTPLQGLAATTVVAMGAALQGTIGFGLGLFAAPILLLIEPRLVPGPLLGASGVLTLLLTRREWRGVQIRDLGWALSGRLVGTLGALAVLTTFSKERLDLLFGVLVLTAVVLVATGLHPRPVPGVLLSAGALSGFMGTTTTIGGPPMALVYQGETGPRLRGTLSAFFVVGVVVSVIALAAVGRFGLAELGFVGLLVPGILIGYWISRHTSTRMDRGPLRPAVLVVSAIAGIVVILRVVAE